MAANQKSITPMLFVLILLIASVAELSFGQTIVYPADSSLQELIAAKEVRRYIYLRTGQKLPLKKTNSIPENEDLILIADDDNQMVESLRDSLSHKTNPGGFIIKTVKKNSRQILIITGYDSISTLYGAYRFAEHIGVGFSLIRDVIPDKKITLDISGFDEVGEPLLKTRGILPFHDFPEGPDLWNTDDYMAVISQLPKLGMNFIGLHTYPLAGATQDKDMNILQGPEPTVWIGLEQNINSDGTVKWSYPSYYAHTHRPDRRWGFAEYDTERFHAGASQLFETNGFGSDVIGEVMPSDVKSSNQVFNRTGKMFKKAFNHANNLGVKTAVGTELPMGLEPKGPEVDYDWIRAMPPELQKRLTSMEYDGPPLIMVDALRTSLYGNEPLNLKVRVMGKPESVTLFYRPLGKGKYESKQLTHIGRGLFLITVPPQQNDFEYYLEAQISTGNIVYPVTAPNLNQTVIVIK